MTGTPRRIAVALGIAAGVTAVALAVADIALRTVVDPAFVEERIEAALNRAAGPDAYRVRIGDVDTSALRRSIRVRTLEITRTDAGEAGAGTPSVDIRAAEIAIGGFEPVRWLLTRTAAARSLRIMGPRVTLWTAPGPSAPRGTGPEAERRTAVRAATDRSLIPTARLAARLPTIVLDELRVDSAEFARSVRGAGPAGRHHLWDLSIESRDVRVDSAAAADPDRVVFARALEAAIGGYTFVSSDSLTRVRVNGLAMEADGCVRADSVSMRPTVDVETFLRRIEIRRDRVDAFAGSVSACPGDRQRLIGPRALVARGVTIDSFDVAVYTDLRLPPPPGNEPAWRPHALIRTVPPLAIDSVRVSGGRIRYAERARDSREPGLLSLEEVDLRIANIRSPGLGEVAGGAGDMRARMVARLMGRAPTISTLDLSLDSDDLAFRYRGDVGAMDGVAFNELMLPLTGIEIEGGRMDTAWFDFGVNDRSAAGDVVPLYRDFAVAVVGKDGGGADLIETLESLIADARIAERNPPEPGAEPRVGRVDYTVQPTDPFFTVIWAALRSGLMDAIGM